jgi:hypothetical protein
LRYICRPLARIGTVLSCADAAHARRSGDQGFLNSYFAALPGAPLFTPPDDAEQPARGASERAAASAREAAPPDSLWRLPTAYNADVGLYVLNRRGGGGGERWTGAAGALTRRDTCRLTSRPRARSNKWPLPRASLRVLHFTLGPLKPWQWWAPWLVPAADEWQAVRRRTPGATPLGADGTWAELAAGVARLAVPWLALGARPGACALRGAARADDAGNK